MNNRKLIFISVFNHGAIELAKNHLQSLANHGITNYMAYCTAAETKDELTSLGYNAEQVKSEIDESKHDFGTNNFNKLSYLRYIMILKLMKDGYDVWYMDVDTVVCGNLNDVYRQVVAENKCNAIIQTDVNMLCTGCMLLFNHPSIQRFLHELYTASFTHGDGRNDQIVFNQLLTRFNDPNIRVGVLPPFQFPNGLIFFKDDFVRTQVPQYIQMRNEFHSSPKNVMFVHANWMVGVDTKINALKAYGLWHI